jgi:hypothetical protein
MGSIRVLRPSFTIVASSPAAGENAKPVATTCDVSWTPAPAQIPNARSSSPIAVPSSG